LMLQKREREPYAVEMWAQERRESGWMDESRGFAGLA
jgi:hypothetical protein